MEFKDSSRAAISVFGPLNLQLVIQSSLLHDSSHMKQHNLTNIAQVKHSSHKPSKHFKVKVQIHKKSLLSTFQQDTKKRWKKH